MAHGPNPRRVSDASLSSEGVLAHLDGLARPQMERADMPPAVAAEGDPPPARRLDRQDRQARQEAVECPLEWPQAHVHRGTLPAQDGGLAVDTSALQFQVRRRYRLAPDVG